MSRPSLLLLVDNARRSEYAALFREFAPDRPLQVWSDGVSDRAGVAYACVWNAPHGALSDFPDLKIVFNLGAGADHLLADPALPDVPVVRAADRDLSMRMAEYVVLHTLMFHRRQRLYDAQQRERIWKGHDQPAAGEVAVGVMGLGEIGSEVAAVLARIGFDVAGWSRTPRSIQGIATFHGAAGLGAFLARTEILVCLLPLTPQTRGLIDLRLLRGLKRDGALGGAFLVNAGRGQLQKDADILTALDQGVIAGAALDVFEREPLPAESALWTHPRVTVTPHNAGDIAPRILVAGICRQIAQFEQGLPLQHVVDRRRGY